MAQIDTGMAENPGHWSPWALTFWPWNYYASHIRGGNLRSKFGHARRSGSGVIRYVRDERTDRRTDKSNAYCLLTYGLGHNKPLLQLFSAVFQFLSRDAMQAQPMSSCGVCMFVCVSLCLFVTFLNSVKTNKPIFNFFSLSVSQAILVFSTPNIMAIFRQKSSNEGVECMCGRQKS